MLYLKPFAMTCLSFSSVLELLEFYLFYFSFLVLSVVFFTSHVNASENFWQIFWGILCVIAFLFCVVFAFIAHWIFGLAIFPICLAAFYPLFMWEAT